MKKNLSLIITIGLVLSSCDNKQRLTMTNNEKKSKDCLPDSLSALVKGKKLLIEKYGYIDSTNHTFKAVLTDDSIWHIVVKSNLFEIEQMKDTIPPNQGSKRVLINKHNCDVIGFYMAR